MSGLTQASRLDRPCLPSGRRTSHVAFRCNCQASQATQRNEVSVSRRATLASLSALCALQATAGPSQAAGIDSLQSLFPAIDSKLVTEPAAATKKKLQDAEDSFQSSDLLKRLKEQTTSNQKKNKVDLQNKYCYRQAEIGIGDCGGLRLIPGMTKSGKQKTPDWLNKFLGVKEEDIPKDVPRPAGFPDINGKPT